MDVAASFLVTLLKDERAISFVPLYFSFTPTTTFAAIFLLEEMKLGRYFFFESNFPRL